jgi:hypothetical protein
MREVNGAPIAPESEGPAYLVLDDFAELGRVYRETPEAQADLESVIRDMLSGQYNRPVRVIMLNLAENMCRDVSEEVAWEVLKRSTSSDRWLTAPTRDFVRRFVGEETLLRTENALL